MNNDEYRCLDCPAVLRAADNRRSPARCRPCTRRHNHGRPRDPRAKWVSRLWWQYGITVEQYEELLSRQGGCCAICGAAEPGGTQSPDRVSWNVDHDHETGAVRGLLCSTCNRALGLLRDDPAACRRAADYLEAARTARSGR